ncbi:MAG: acyl carrier protein [Mobilitalea sp.]
MTDKIIKIIAEKLNLEEKNIGVDANFGEDLGIDSLDLFELVIALEEEFDIEIPQEDVANIQTVNDVESYLKSRGL